MKFLIQSILFVSIALLVVQNQLLLAFMAALLFTYYRNAIWLIPLGFLIDGYFDAFYTIPVFSLVAIFWYVVSEFLKPRVRGYTTNI